MKLKLLLILLLLIPTASAIQITEIMYNLKGADAGREWIEVYVDKATNFDGWRLYEAETNHKLKLIQGNFSLDAGDYFIIVDNPEKFLETYPAFEGNMYDSTFSLSNKGEILTLRDSNLEDIHTVTYNSDYGAAGDGNSLQHSSINWTSCPPTPGKANCEPETSEDEQEISEPELEPEQDKQEVVVYNLSNQNTTFDSGVEKSVVIEDFEKENIEIPETQPSAEKITSSVIYESKSSDSLNIAFWLVLLVSISFNVVFLVFVVK